MYRDLTRRLVKPLTGAPHQCSLPYKIAPLVIKERPASVLLPHELFANIYHKYPKVWGTRIVESQESLESFWDAMEGHPLLDHMKLRDREDGYRSNAVPLRIHGDDTPVTGIGKSWTKVCLFFSWTITMICLCLLCAY